MSTETKHRIYLASSWRNERQPEVLAALRVDGHDVYDFRNPAPGDTGFGWRKIGDRSTWTAEHFATHVLDHPIAARGFGLDMAALEACSICVLLLPCGRSAHLELGYAVGAGKLTVVYMPELDEPELMYRMCDYVETTLEGVRCACSQARRRPRWQRDLARHDARFPKGSGNEYGGALPCTITQTCYRNGPEQARAEAIVGGPLPERGPCREYHHRECAVCRGCWRHGTCACGPAAPRSEGPRR